MPYNWTFDQTRQELHSPAGYTVSVREIAQLLADRRDCKYDFHGEWSGWKMRRQFLIPPFSGRNGPKLTPSNARQFLDWANEPAQLDAQRRLRHAAESRPRLCLVR